MAIKLNQIELDNTMLRTIHLYQHTYPNWLFTTKAHKSYASVKYGADDFLVFGKGTKGLSIDYTNSRVDNAVRIPMFNDLRCLNLSNSVAIAAYEALRQHNFFDMDVKISYAHIFLLGTVSGYFWSLLKTRICR